VYIVVSSLARRSCPGTTELNYLKAVLRPRLNETGAFGVSETLLKSEKIHLTAEVFHLYNGAGNQTRNFAP
jgi:hypothetical protein